MDLPDDDIFMSDVKVLFSLPTEVSDDFGDAAAKQVLAGSYY